MEKLTQEQFDKKYGQGHEVYFKEDIDAFNSKIEKAIEHNPGFSKDIRERANAQMLDLERVEIIKGNSTVTAFVRKAKPEPDLESFNSYKEIICKALEDNLLDERKAEDLIIKAGKKYNVGDISDSTGLQKQADGSWAPPKKGGKSKKDESDDKGSKEKKKSSSDSKDKKKPSADSKEKDKPSEKYFGPESENDVQKFKNDLKSGKISREKAIMELKGIGMDDDKVQKIIDKLSPNGSPKDSIDEESKSELDRLAGEESSAIFDDPEIEEMSHDESVSDDDFVSKVVEKLNEYREDILDDLSHSANISDDQRDSVFDWYVGKVSNYVKQLRKI